MPSAVGVLADSYNKPAAGGGPSLPVLTGLLGWFDADDAASFDVSTGNVRVWRDRSPNGYTATYSPGYDNPFYEPERVLNSMNGHATVDFINSPEVLQTPMPSDTKPFTFTFTSRITSLAGTRIPIGINGTGAPRIDVRTDGIAHVFMPGVGELGGATTAITAGSPFVLTVTYSATGVLEFWLNGVAAGSSTNNVTFTAGLVTQLGASNNGESLVGSLAEVVKYDRVLTTTERQQVESYLYWKWMATPPPFTTTGLVGWWDAGSYSGGATWDNQAPGPDLTRSSANTGIRTVSGKSMVATWATGSVQSAQWTAAFGTLTLPRTIFCASWWSSNTITDHVGVAVWQDSGTGEMRATHYTANQFILGYNSPSITITQALRDDASHVFSGQHNGTGDCWLGIDGVRTTGSGQSGPFTDLTFGVPSWTGWNTGSPTVWAYGEIIIYDRVLSTVERQQVESYLKTKWGTP